MVKVSIVIPVYNRKNFLTVCIKSLLAQSFEDFEICLVDDGSTGQCKNLRGKFINCYLSSKKQIRPPPSLSA